MNSSQSNLLILQILNPSFRTKQGATIKKGEKKEVLDTADIKVTKPKGNGSKVAGKLNKDTDTATKKTRIQIKQRTNDESDGKNEASNGKKERKKPFKRKREDEGDDEGGEANVELAPIPKKRKNDGSQSKKKSADSKVDESGSAAAKSSGGGDDNDTPTFLNLEYWKQCRESLNGTFKAARKNLTKFDGWTLPEDLVGKFTEIANITLEKMNK